jgi:hypothetical protein
MDISLLELIFYLLLIDSIAANIIAWGPGEKWWNKHGAFISRYFPIARGWTAYYLVLVLFIGYIIFFG